MLPSQTIHPSWQPILQKALGQVDKDYLNRLEIHTDWLPGKHAIFNAFSLPLENLHYILWGESPYPRKGSANGYAFWDAAVTDIWSETGLTKAVNRATSLRNFIKMLLLARGDLKVSELSQNHIAKVDKSDLLQTLSEVFQNLQSHGFLLLNASLVLSKTAVKKEARYWQPFMQCLLAELKNLKPDLKLLLFGNVAKSVIKLSEHYQFEQLTAEHPYNLSFIQNPEVLAFFKPFDLLRKH